MLYWHLCKAYMQPQPCPLIYSLSIWSALIMETMKSLQLQPQDFESSLDSINQVSLSYIKYLVKIKEHKGKKVQRQRHNGIFSWNYLLFSLTVKEDERIQWPTWKKLNVSMIHEFYKNISEQSIPPTTVTTWSSSAWTFWVTHKCLKCNKWNWNKLFCLTCNT